MICAFKAPIPEGLSGVLTALYPVAMECARAMLRDRSKSSSKHWKQLPCVVSKSLIRKYQRNRKCLEIRSLAIPVCGDKGKQVKIVEGGLRIPALFKKSVIPCCFPKPIDGFILQVEFIRRDGRWFIFYAYSTPCISVIKAEGCVGVDRNSVGNIAVMADCKTGIVRKLGFDPAKTKSVFRGRKKNLQKAGKFKLLAKLKRKQSRRTTFENHRVSKTVVTYASTHRCAVVLEKLSGVVSEKSKIRRFSQKSQWAFAQLESMIRYKCALRGVPLLLVDPAFTSQDCSRCGSRNIPNGKQYHCKSCGHNSHRDANAAFNISKRGIESLSVRSSNGHNVPLLEPIGGLQAENVGAL